MNMKAIAIVGSPRKHGNTEILAAHTLKAVAEEGIETELIPLAGRKINPCNACDACLENGECVIKDGFASVFNKMIKADGIILASPVYFGSCTALLKALMERAGWLSTPEKRLFNLKVGGPLVVARRAGQNFTLAEINFWFHIQGMIVPGSTYWNIASGWHPGEVANDEEGLNSAWNFGKNMAFVMKKIA
jgi:multimeric flavodoxin WrbA